MLRDLGLMVDGPTRWGSPAPSRLPGIFIVELPGGAASAPIDVVAVRRWIERVPAMRLDGEEPTPQTLALRLHEFWLPNEPILYVGRSSKSISGRVAALNATALGDAKPHSGGHWLRTLSVLNDLRVWWSETDAHEEYEDALVELVAERNDNRTPFANLIGPDGSPRPTGLTNSLLSEDISTASQRASAKAAPKAKTPRTSTRKAPAPRLTGARARPASEPTYLSREGLEKLTAELDNLKTVVRPEVIERVATARSHGDLKENAEYEYARKEQSFTEGRIQTLEALIRTAAIVDEAAASDGAVALGSTLVVESDGERDTYMLVSSAEASLAEGRISNVSPVGRALMGSRAGDEVTVQLPGGSVVYRVLEVR